MVDLSVDLYFKDSIEAFHRAKEVPGGVHEFIKRISKVYPFLSVEEVSKFIFGEIENSLNIVSGESKIPKIFHRVWLTSDSCPQAPDKKYLAVIKDSITKLPDWQHYLWCNNDSVAKQIDEFVGTSNFRVLNPYTFSEGLQLLKNVDSLISSGKFAFACDQLRIDVIHKFGGLYGDVGVRPMHNIDSLMNGVNYVFLLSNFLFFQNSFFGAAAKDPLFSRLIEIQKNPYQVPYELVGEVDPITEGWLASGLMFTLLYLLGGKNKSRIFVGNGELLAWGSQRSWYQRGEGTAVNGSTIVSESDLDLISSSRWKNSERFLFL